ncbi:MAG: inositol monophosphatase family protein [Elusimicrobiota bacterium]|jgi:myo-inositol-1(or 4)-monophosphatase
MLPLRGKTVLLTRPKARAEGLTRALARKGARVVHAPLIRTVPPPSWSALDRALRELPDFDAVVFASASAVSAFFGRARTLGLRPRPPRRLYAVGPATAAALRERGWNAAAVPERHEARALARRMGKVRGARILLPRALEGREELPRALRRAGARLVVAPAYRTVPDPEGLRALRALTRRGETPDWTVFASPSAVEAFFSALGAPAARGFLAAARAASIGPTTSAALRRRGIEPAAEAGRRGAEELAGAVARREAVPRALLRRTLHEALRAGGAVLRARFGKVHIRYKGRANLVTEADHASEQRVLDIVLARFPDHSFLTEERAPRTTASDFTWVIDPLDGTTNYAHGFPAFCVSIGLLRRGRPFMGGVYDPSRGELFFAELGRGATLNGRPLRVSAAGRVEDSLLLTGFAYDRARRADYLLRFYSAFMKRCHDVRRSGSAALDLAWTAAGRVDGYWEFSLNPWDVAAGALLVQEAGGKVTAFDGLPWNEPESFGRQTLASNGRIHAQMLRVMRPLL